MQTEGQHEHKPGGGLVGYQDGPGDGQAEGLGGSAKMCLQIRGL